jgi:hypothetical protein
MIAAMNAKQTTKDIMIWERSVRGRYLMPLIVALEG